MDCHLNRPEVHRENGYIALYKGKKREVRAATAYAAEQAAAKLFDVPPKQSYKVSVYLCERADGSEVMQVITA